MRGALVALAAAFTLAALPARAETASHGTTISTPTFYALQQQPPAQQPPAQPPSAQPPTAPDKTIDINVTHTQGGRWYANPMWVAIGALAVVVVLLLVVLAARGGGGTTIVKD